MTDRSLPGGGRGSWHTRIKSNRAAGAANNAPSTSHSLYEARTLRLPNRVKTNRTLEGWRGGSVGGGSSKGGAWLRLQ